MYKLYVLIACVSAVSAALHPFDYEIRPVDGKTALMAQYPTTKLVPIDKEVSFGGYDFSLGKHQFADVKLDTFFKSYESKTPQNLEAVIWYPSKDKSGLEITHLTVTASSDSGDVQAYLLHGGVKQRHAVILLKANGAKKLSYGAEFFGYPDIGPRIKKT